MTPTSWIILLAGALIGMSLLYLHALLSCATLTEQSRDGRQRATQLLFEAHLAKQDLNAQLAASQAAVDTLQKRLANTECAWFSATFRECDNAHALRRRAEQAERDAAGAKAALVGVMGGVANAYREPRTPLYPLPICQPAPRWYTTSSGDVVLELSHQYRMRTGLTLQIPRGRYCVHLQDNGTYLMEPLS